LSTCYLKPLYGGNIALNDDFVHREAPSMRLAGLGYEDLVKNHAEIAEIFDTLQSFRHERHRIKCRTHQRAIRST
jgi:hypothetical protein